MRRQVLRILGLLLVAAGLAAENATAGESGLITPQAIQGTGEYSNSPSLIIDGQTLAEETAWNDDACVYWEKPQASFVITLDGVYQITGATIQADNNDDYVIETSMDGSVFSPLLVVLGDWGGVFSGVETLSTLADDPHFSSEMAIAPVQAKYVRLSARNGDEAYSISELSLYGSKVECGSVGPVVVTGQGTTPSTAVSSLLKAQSIRGVGKYTRSEKLIIDGKMPEQGTKYNSRQCVYWRDPRTHFIIDLGQVQRIDAVAMQVDGDDTYVLEVSADGEKYAPLVVVAAAWGEVTKGMETVSMLRDDPQYLPMMLFRPVDARYVSISARDGNKAYAVSEVFLYGGKKPEATPPIQPSVGPVPPVTTPEPVGGPGSMEDVFNAVDKDKDGRISKAEYAAIWKDKLDVDKNFAFFDKDNSGFIGKTEFMSLRDGLGEEASQDQTEQTEEGSARLDPVLVQKAIDALPTWPKIQDLMAAGKFEETNTLVKEAGFENWFDLNLYFSTVCAAAQSIEADPQSKDTLATVFGEEAVDVIAQPENLARIKANAPTSPSR